MTRQLSARLGVHPTSEVHCAQNRYNQTITTTHTTRRLDKPPIAPHSRTEPRPQNTHIFSPACLLCQDWKTWKSWLLSPVRAKNSCPRRCRHRGGVCAKRSWLRRRPPRETHQHASCKRSAWSKSTAFLTFDGCVCEDADAQLAMPCLLYRCKLQRRENILQVVSETLAKPHGCAP